MADKEGSSGRAALRQAKMGLHSLNLSCNFEILLKTYNMYRKDKGKSAFQAMGNILGFFPKVLSTHSLLE